MKKTRILMSLAGILLLAGLALAGCTKSETASLKVVTSTSHLEQLVMKIGGDLVDVINIVPAASHPGDFDASPGDIRKLADADLFLWHNWPGEKYVPGLLDSAGNTDIRTVTIEIEGSWMTPPVHLKAIEKVAAALSEADSVNNAKYLAAAEAYKKEIEAVQSEVKATMAEYSLSGVNVICAGWQAGFLKWAGVNVVATYGLPVPPTAADIEKMITTGREKGVKLIVDNLHDNPDAGKPIAAELNCSRIILYNFPGVDKETKSWSDTLKTNINLLLGALPSIN